MILNKNLIFFFIFLLIASCSSVPKYPQNACKIFGEKYFYLKYSRASSKKWGIPISSILAVINKESGFKRFAKPKRKKIFKIIPYRRPSSSLGFSQAVNKTWDLYKKENNKPRAITLRSMRQKLNHALVLSQLVFPHQPVPGFALVLRQSVL